ncbi:MAG: TonB-dependent receptor [Thermoanaerobaculaceae bacterium]
MKKMRIFLALFTFVFSGLAMATTGTVQDAQEKPIPYARVAVLGQPSWIVTDAQGRFTLPKGITPPFTLVVTGSDGVLLGSFQFVELPKEPFFLVVQPQKEEVTITASRPPDLVTPPATAFTMISQQALELRSPGQLIDALETVPNVGRVGGDHAAVPALRGLARFRSLILLDGTRVLTERRVGPSATFLDPLSLGEVEVVRGAAGVAYGSDAFGGVIAARTRLFAPGQSWQLRYALVGATGAPEHGATVEAGGSLGLGALTLGIGGRHFDRYDSPDGEVHNSEASFHAARLGYQFPLGRGMLRLLWRSDWGRDIGRTSVTSREDRTTYPEENSHRFVLGYEGQLPPPWTRQAWQVSWVEYQILTERDRIATGTTPRRLSRADVFAHDYNVRWEAERRWAGGQLLLGTEAYGRFGLRATNDYLRFQEPEPSRTREVSIASARKDDFGAFAAFNRQLSVFKLDAGIRADHTKAKNSGGYFGNRSFDFTRGSGFLGVTWQASDGLQLAVQYAKGFRDAVLSDRFYRGITGRGFVTGNPELKPETSKQWDVALRYSAASWRGALYGYWYEIFHYIERFRQGRDYFFRNRGKARLKGLEGELTLRLPGEASLLLGLQLPYGKIVDDDTFMDDVPAQGGFVLYSQRLGRISWETRLAAYRRDTRPGPTEQVVPGYARWDLGASYRFSQQLEIGLYGRNLLDRKYLSSPDAAAVLAPGRSLQLTLRGILGW